MVMVSWSLTIALQALTAMSSSEGPIGAASFGLPVPTTWFRPQHTASSAGPFPSRAPRIRRHRSQCAIPSFSRPASTAAGEEQKELTPAAIAEMVEVSFLNSCLQLSQGYIDVLKLFIVAVKAGHESNLSLRELHRLVEECPVNSAGRDLAQEERALRFEWMKVVYSMLDSWDPDSVVVDSYDIAGDDRGGKAKASNARVAQVVKAMLTIQQDIESEERATGGQQDAAVTLTNLTVEQALERSPLLSKLNESTLSDPTEKAFLTNDIRVALMMYRVLEEEKICMQDAAGRTMSGSEGSQLPRPPIPGT